MVASEMIARFCCGQSRRARQTKAGFGLSYPLLLEQYPKRDYQVKHVVGIDRSPLRAARTGARGANDLVWVGRAANYAAKLSSLSDNYASRITADVFNQLNAELKVTNGKNMWEEAQWTDMGNMTIYRSTWMWQV